MKTLYLDCSMGAAGDMLTAALYELMPDRQEALSQLNSLGIEGVEYIAEDSVKCGVKGTHISVRIHGGEEDENMHSHHDHGHHRYASPDDITKIINSLNTDEEIKNDIKAVYDILARAESEAHGVPVGHVHFHEVGSLDAVADIGAVCLLMRRLMPCRVVASPVNTGSGQVKCAHGILPVPAPATANILKGIPAYSGNIKSELCTPTGAALLRYFADEFGNMPVISAKAVGYGVGKKDFEAANCVRAIYGESEGETGSIIELKCNIDDMTGEEIGFALNECFKAGAVDAFTIPAGMKKNRPGVIFCALCSRENRDAVVSAIFKHTSTIGVRESDCVRYTLSRTEESVATRYGDIRKKISSGFGVSKEKYEYDDISRIAAESGVSIAEILKSLNETNQ